MHLKKLAKGILFSCFTLFSFMAFAQNKNITGKVTDSKDGSPIPGITISGVTATGKRIGTATKVDGT